MSTIDMTVVSGSLQTLIDARLDAIDRALLGRVSRQERLNVVGEVEGRIHELLHDRRGHGVEPSREDVLAVLSRLDPPEAYLAEVADDDAPRASRRRAQPPAVASGTSELKRLARGSGVLGLTSLAMLLLFPFAFLLRNAVRNDLPIIFAMYGGGAFMLIGGLASVYLALQSRMRSSWAIVGFVSGALAGSLALVFLTAR